MPRTKQKPAARSAKPKTAAETKPELSKLSQLQEFLCDTLGDLIVRGGHPDDVYDLLYDAAYYHHRKRFGRMPNEGDQQLKDRLKKRAEDDAEEWQRRLAKDWPEPEKTEETPPPKNVIQRVRAVLTERLEDCIHDFMLEATPEEKRLLTDVLQNRENISIGPDLADPELNLATAFMEEIEAEERYIQVPNERIKDLVVRYVDLLAEGKDAKVAVVPISAASA